LLYIYTQSIFILVRDNSISNLTSRLAAKPPVKYTVGLSIIEDNLINGMGSVAYLNQVSIMAKGAPNVIGTYFVQFDDADNNGYYDIENGYAYYEKQYQQS
jgi:hypothetical protein